MDHIIPFQAQIVIPLRERDEQFNKIQELIELKRNLLHDKQRKLQKISKQNRFLEVVKDDYLKYHTYIQNQKRDQIKALELLNTYINDLTYSGKLTKNNIEDAKQEQKIILREVKQIRATLDDIVNTTEDVQLSLNK
jgi:hypothetical protein